MTTIVTITSATDSLSLYPTPDVNGWVYDNETLDRWYALPDVDAPIDKRPNAHGAYGLGTVYAGAAEPIVAGQFFGTTPTASLLARRRLAAFFADGNAVTIAVEDELGTASRVSQLVALDAPFRFGFTDFHFDAAFVAVDPRRYGPTLQVGPVGLPAASSGLVYPLNSVGGIYWNWGSAGASGQVAFTNTGFTTTYPRIVVGGPGTFVSGFVVTEVETGRELRYQRETAIGQDVVFDSRTERATVNNADVTGALSSRQWFSVPPGATRRYQINALGSTTGAPTITLFAAPAEM